MPIYRPRMLAQLDVPVMGSRQERIGQAASSESQSIIVQPRRVRIERADHNHADSCTLELDWFDAGVDPRMLSDAVVTVWIANANEDGYWQPSVENTRFIGVLTDNERTGSNDDPMLVTLEALDYTDFFLKAKPFGSDGIPKYSQRLDEAWRTIVSQTPGAAVLANRLKFTPDITAPPALARAVAARFAKLAQVPTDPETDAWAVWQQCVGMVGLISWIDLDRCIVSTATNLYTADDPPVLAWGQNALSITESRHSGYSGHGIGLTSFDPLTGRTLEAFYPPEEDEKAKRKKPNAKRALTREEMTIREGKRDFYALPGVTSELDLVEIARRVYEESSRQELEGRASTAELVVKTASGRDFDMLRLKAGDAVRIDFDRKDKQTLASLDTDDQRRAYLKERGFNPQTVELMIRNMQEFASLSSTFLVKTVTTDISVDDMGGEVEIQVDFINRIEPQGDTADAP